LEPDIPQNVAFYDQLASEYDSKLTGRREDVLARRAFHDLVETHVAAGSTVLDFGCGTGLDAQHFARAGYRVLAYDNSPGMLAQLGQRCAAEIAAGQILPKSCDYASFEAGLSEWPAANAAVSNFAVVNLIREPRPLFEMLARRLAAPGWLIVSVLNPIHWALLKQPGWWKNAVRGGALPHPHSTEPCTTYLHRVPALLRAASSFRLVGRANSGSLVRYQARGAANRWWGDADADVSTLRRAIWNTPAYRWMGHFVFLVLRRDF
jgi:SAM-dependent methyltransferase